MQRYANKLNITTFGVNFLLMAKIYGKKTVSYPGMGNVIYIKKTGTATIRIRISHTQGITVTMPPVVPYTVAETFFISRKDDVIRAMERLEARQELSGQRKVPAPATPEEKKRMKEDAEKVLLPFLEAAACKYGFRYNRISFKNNRSNWGSCSSKGNINLNMRLVMLPQHLQEYVILHELCHLRHPDHGKEFHALLDRLCQGQEKELRKELRSWLII